MDSQIRAWTMCGQASLVTIHRGVNMVGLRGIRKIESALPVVLNEPLLEELIVYLRLGRVCRERNEVPQSDRFMTIAGACAWMLGIYSVSQFCRQQIIGHNPGHFVARHPHFGSALHDPDFQALLGQLVRKYPPDEAAQLLKKFNQPFSAKRDDFPNDTAFAAAAVGVDSEWLDACFGTE